MYNYRISGFGDEAGKTAEEQIQVLNINGIQNIEIRSINGKNIIELNDEELKTLKEKFDRANIKVSAIGSPVGKTPIEEDFKLARAAFDRALCAAIILDAPYIRAFSFYMPKSGSGPMQYADEVIFRLKELVKAAEQKGKKYALENESGIFTDIPERCVYVLERIPDLGFVFDPANFVLNNANTLEAWKVLKNRVTYFHIKDAVKNPGRSVPAGEGEGNIPEILKEAYSGGFDGYISIEPHLKYMENLNDAERFTTAANALRKVLANQVL